MPIKDGYYPISINESRYSGTYSGGEWILTAGIRNPRQSDAFGSDIPCMEFWTRVERDGPLIEIESVTGSKEVYVASGSNPVELLQEMQDFFDEDFFEGELDRNS